MPVAGLGLGLVPDPDTGLQVLGNQLSFLTPTQAQALLGVGRLGGGPVVDPHCGRRRLGMPRAAPASRPYRHLRSGVLQINRLITMDIRHEPAAQGVEPL